MRLSIITPTRGRLSLRKTLESIKPQLRDGDEHIVVGDGPQVAARYMAKEFGATYYQGPATAQYGNAQRDLAISKAHGDYLLFCDDDDRLTESALEHVRATATAYAGDPLIYRFQVATGALLWRDPSLYPMNVGGAMLALPNNPARLGSWQRHAYLGILSDYGFIADTLQHYPQEHWRWVDHVLMQIGTRNGV